jgi:hypothetical protein
MGAKFKYFVVGLLFLNIAANGQKSIDFQYVDTLTYKYYSSGDWNQVISLGMEAINNDIDYKFLRQRLGFAFYSKGDFINARKHLERALLFDSFDTFTLTYLYYAYLSSGLSENARLISAKMPSDLKKSLSVKPFHLVESVDFEYNFKYAASGLRSNPRYFHVGIHSQIGSRLGLYQMVSGYNQTLMFQQMGYLRNARDNQSEYYGLVKLTLTPHLTVKSAYHYLNTSYNATGSSSHLGFFELTANFNRVKFGMNSSLLKGKQLSVVQTGLDAGIFFSGKMNVYFNSALSFTSMKNTGRFIYDQKAGFKVSKNIWVEGNLTLGDMTNYRDHEAMYIYNLVDATTLRTGATLFLYTGKHISLWANYSYERKEYYENSIYHYNQFSYLGGIKWKL